MQRTLQHGSFSSVSQPLIVWSVLCPLNIFPVLADNDGSGGGIASWVAMGVIAVAGSWNSSVISSSVDGWSVARRRPVGWREQVLGTDLRSYAVCTLSLLFSTFPHGPHTNFLYSESNRMFRFWNKKCSEIGPNRRCSGPKQYPKQFRYYY